MKKKFKAKRKIKYQNIIYSLIFIIISIMLLKYLLEIKIMNFNIISTLNTSNIYTQTDYKKYIKELKKNIIGININNPTTILQNVMLYESANTQYELVHMDKETSEPEIYIYNTHQKEEYQKNETDNTSYNVMNASYYLKDKLELKGIKTIVEEQNIQDILSNNNWKYNESYKASRINLEKIKNEYPSIKIFIDLHRDAVNKQNSTTTINDKTCAKVLFVIGLEHDNYLKNLKFTQTIDELIKKNYPNLTKGILKKEGPGVNGIYNQDLKENIILLEVGGNENTKEEVTNTLDIIADIIEEKLNEEK